MAQKLATAILSILQQLINEVNLHKLLIKILIKAMNIEPLSAEFILMVP